MAWVLLCPEFEAPVLPGEEAARLPGLWGMGGVAGRGCGARGTRGHRLQPGPGLATGGHCSTMASRPPRPSCSLKYRDKDWKTCSPIYLDKGGKKAPREMSVQPPLVPAADGAPGRRRLPLVTLVKAMVRFKRLASEVRRGHILPSLNPLATEQPKMPEKRSMPEKTFWGDQEPLSKVRTALGEGVGGKSTRESGRDRLLASLGPPVKLCAQAPA